MTDDLTRDTAGGNRCWRESVEEAASLWRDHYTGIDDLCHHLHNEMLPLLLYWALSSQRRLYRRYLRARFGIGFHPDGRLYIIKRRLRSPRMLHDLGQLTCALETYAVLDAVFGALLWATVDSQDGSRGAEKALDVLRDAPVLASGEAMRFAPHPDQREAAVYSMAGWADTQVRLFSRLRAALCDTDKQEELLSAIPLAWAERKPGEPLTGPGSTISRITKLLTRLGMPPQEVPKPEVTAATGFHAQEEARWQLQQLVEQAGLSERESQVLDLHLKEYSHRQIAQTLGLAEGSIKSTWSRTMKKLRDAANAP